MFTQLVLGNKVQLGFNLYLKELTVVGGYESHFDNFVFGIISLNIIMAFHMPQTEHDTRR